MVRPRPRVRPALELPTAPTAPARMHAPATSLSPATTPAAVQGHQCARCRRHLTAKHEPREVEVWGLANRPLRVVVCSDCAEKVTSAS